ncbi:hypothetical protein [uncultured Bifidobacterium sp.]|uniref:hypothetical protein n=1 Tax=uncultured Bifidobacterium sp. TaxID=165187 RepID=UPI0025D89B10|nr:hypothetical protein [uncultured Bifidobacterium sp.]
MKTRLLALILTIMSGAVSLAGCGGFTRSEPSLEDVSGRFAAMKTYDLTGDGGKVTISAKKQGTVYLLAMRPDLRKVDAGRCTVDGKTMRSSSSNLNYPAGQGKNFLAFAESSIVGGNHQLACTQNEGTRLLALFEPAS